MLDKALIVALALVASVTAAAAADTAQTRATMRQLFDSVRTLLPRSVDPQRFADPAADAVIRQALRRLSDHAEILAAHAVDDDADAGFEYLSRSLATDSVEAYRQFTGRHYDRSRSLIRQITHVCAGCHIKLPSAADASLSEGFISDRQLATLPLAQQAGLLLTTRQFDDALTAYETLFDDPAAHPAELIDGPLVDYLTVCIRVKGDLSRPLPVLERLQRRPDLWRLLRQDIAHWSAQLRAASSLDHRPADLSRGRELINDARAVEAYAMDRKPLVQYLIASALLNRLVKDAADRPAAEMAEAYYLLGMTEYRIGHDYPLRQGEHYLETAIRLTPGAAVARRAYALLEQELIFGYSGSSGTHLPPDVQRHLERLRRLADGEMR